MAIHPPQYLSEQFIVTINLIYAHAAGPADEVFWDEKIFAFCWHCLPCIDADRIFDMSIIYSSNWWLNRYKLRLLPKGQTLWTIMFLSELIRFAGKSLEIHDNIIVSGDRTKGKLWLVWYAAAGCGLWTRCGISAQTPV